MPITFTSNGIDVTFESPARMYDKYFRCHLWLGKIPSCRHCDHVLDCTTLDEYFFVAYDIIQYPRTVHGFNSFDDAMSQIFSHYDEYLAEIRIRESEQELVYTGKASAWLGVLDSMFS